MKLPDCLALISAYEKLAHDIRGAVDARKDLETKLGADLVGKLVDAFPSAAAFTTFAEAMPKAPALAEVVAAFPDPKELTGFIDGALKGNVKVFSVLAERGCGRNPAVLKQLADEFKVDPTPMQAMVDEGGLGAQPEAMAALLQGGCEADPKKLKLLFAKFGTPEERKKLANSLQAGGLGQAPDALGALVKHDGGDLLKKLTGDFEKDPEKLRGVLTEGGCDGKAPGRPGLLTDVITKGLGGSPARLKELHDAFTGELGDLNRLLTGMDGDDGKAGDRLAKLLDNFKKRVPASPLTDKQAVEKLRDPYLSSISKFSMTGRMPDVTGLDGTKAGIAAVTARATPPAAQASGTIAAGIKDGAAGGLLAAGLSDPTARAAAASAQALTAGLGQRADALGAQAAEGDPTQTVKTEAATKAAIDKLAGVQKRLEGAPTADIEALAKLGVAALEAARIEPDDTARKAALAAAKAVEQGVAEALKRVAAATLAKSPGAAGATAAQAASAALPSTTPKGVKDAATATASAAFISTAAAQGALEDPATAAAAAKKAIEAAYQPTERPAKEQEANEAAKTATMAAETALGLVKTAPPPVDAALLGRAADAAAVCVAKARGAPDQPTATAAFDAAKTLTAAIDTAVKEATARLTLAAAQASPDGKAALAAANEADIALDLVGRLAPGVATAELQRAAKATRAGALTGTDAAAMEAADKPMLQKAAQDAAFRTAAATIGGEPDANAVTTAVSTADALAVSAEKDATAATAALTTAAVATDSDAYAALIEDAAAKAEAALAAARGAVDDGKRDAALSAAKAGAAAAADGAKKLAAHHRDAARTALKTEQTTKIGAASAARDGLATAVPPGDAGARAAGQAAFDAGRAAVGDAAAGELADYAQSDAGVVTANEAVADALAKASMPGADEAAKLALLIAKREAAKALATKAAGKLATDAAALPAAPTGPPAALAVGSEKPFDAALSTAKAANAACLAWHAAALKAQQAAAAFFSSLDAIKNRTAEENAARTAADTAKNLAQGEVDLAAAALAGVDTHASLITSTAKKWSQRANNAATPVTATTKAIQDVAGFAAAMNEDSNARAPAMPEADLIRIGASLTKQAYTGPVHATEPADAGGEPGELDTEHICDRHVRSTYHFDGESCPLGSEHDVGLLLDGALSGKPGKSLQEKALIEQGGRNKPNSFLPEEVDQATLKAWAEATMTEVAKGGAISTQLHTAMLAPAPPPPPPPRPWAKIWLDRTVSITVPPSPATSVTIGLSIAADPGTPLLAANCKPKARMFYANTRDKLSTPDVLVLAKALNFAS